MFCFLLAQDRAKAEALLLQRGFQKVWVETECKGDVNSTGAALCRLRISLSCPQINHHWAREKAITQGLNCADLTKLQ